MEDLSTTGTPEAGTATATPATETAGASNGTGNSNGEATRQGATGTETFIPQGLDVNTLPPNVRAHIEKINSDMVRGFTEKTTKLSETTKAEVAKATEALKAKAEFYDQIAAQQEFVDMWNEHVKKVQANGGQETPGDPKVVQLEKKFQELNEKLQLTELAEVRDAFADAVDEKGEKAHPLFDDLNAINIGQIQGQKGAEDFSLLRACVELAQGTPQQKLDIGYKQAKALYDSIYEQGKKAGMGRLQTKVLNGSHPPSNSTGDTLTVTEKRPKSAREAFEMARKGVVVSRD